MNRYIYLLLASLSVFFSATASAEDYYWQPYGIATKYADPILACKGILGIAAPATWTFRGFTPDSTATLRYCVYDRPEKDGNGNPLYPQGYYSKSNLNVVRRGDSCPPGTTYNSTTMRCEGDPCLSTVDQVIYHEYSFRSLGADGNPDSDPPVTVCKNACQYSHTFESFTANRDGKRPDQMLGSFKYKGNGVSCTATNNVPDQPASADPMSPQQEYLKDSDCEAWVTNPNGTRSRSCLSQDYFNEPGQLKCGTVNGKITCTVGSPSPYSKDVQADSTTTETTNPDGSKDTTTTTTTTTTTCKGLNPCDTGTKTEGTDTSTNPDGTPGDSTQTCTGDDCNPNEEEEQEEEEQCDPATDPDKCGQSSVAGEACDVSVQCSGDAIQCAILRAQKKATCYYESENDYDAVKNEIISKASGDGYSLENGEFDFSNQFSTGTRFLPSGCPAPRSMYISSFNRTYQIEYDPICEFADTLSYIVVAMASLFFVTYVGRAFGGS